MSSVDDTVWDNEHTESNATDSPRGSNKGREPNVNLARRDELIGLRRMRQTTDNGWADSLVQMMETLRMSHGPSPFPPSLKVEAATNQPPSWHKLKPPFGGKVHAFTLKISEMKSWDCEGTENSGELGKTKAPAGVKSKESQTQGKWNQGWYEESMASDPQPIFSTRLPSSVTGSKLQRFIF